jgi:precorrin-4/cobalt-precorrin-4 C11-methyltransferase
MTPLVSFVGAGPGAPDLLTLRAVERLQRADVVVWAASLVPEEVLAHCRPDAAVHDSKSMTLPEVLAVYAAHPQARIVRLHSGDPTLFSTIGEQIRWCQENDRPHEIVPGVSSLSAAAAAAGCELTSPGVSQSVVLTRLARRTAASMPARESIGAFAAVAPTLAVFLSAAHPRELQDELLAPGSAYEPDTPAAVVVRASWPDQQLARTTVGDLARSLEELGATTTTLVLVGEALRGAATRASHVYDPAFSHRYRQAQPVTESDPPAGSGAPGAVAVVGVVGGEVFGRRAQAALQEATLVIGTARHRDALGLAATLPTVDLSGPLAPILDRVAEASRAGQRVCLLASGDPGFFGIARVLAIRLGNPAALQVYPAPSSVALAFARLGTNWEDAVVVSAHGRPLEPAVETCLRSPKTAVLTSPDNPPERLGAALLERHCPARQVSVLSRLGEDGERIVHTDLPGLASGRFDPLSVVVVRQATEQVEEGAERGAVVRWGQPEQLFEHRDGMITKAEVRAVSLSKLGPPRAGVLWDIGAGSGSVAVEAAGLAPALQVYAVDRDPHALDLVKANAIRHGVTVHAVAGSAPAVLAELPDPDAVFVGGGGLPALDATLARLRPGGRVVANFVLLDRALEARTRLGAMCQVAVSRCQPLGDGLMLRPENPVFVCWGPA